MRLVLAVVLVQGLFAQNQPEKPPLQPGERHHGELSGDRLQDHYSLLQAGEYARYHVTQHTVNVAVAVFDPDGKQLFALDNNPIGEVEEVELIAATAGRYRLHLAASEPNAPAGRYDITFAAVSQATDHH